MVGGELTSINDVESYRINGLEQMEPFLIAVVSDSDLWMYASSTGALAAGRGDADHSLFPYVTDDQIHRSAGHVGSVTVVTRTIDGERGLWRPFHTELTPGCTRSIAKSLLGDRLVFEETHPGWRLRIRTTWAPSRTYGWVRTTEILDEGGDGAEIEVLDGLLDVLPAGVDSNLKQIRSNLVNAYGRAETGPWGSLAIYNLESLVTDKAEPAESLAATTVWSWGFEDADVDLDRSAITAVLAGDPVTPTRLLKGRPGAYLLRGTVAVPAAGSASWSMVADTGLDHAQVLRTAHAAADTATPSAVVDDIDAGSARLGQLLAAADGLQATVDPIADAHHLSNVLFNSMRGGVFPFGHRVPVSDFIAFVESRDRVAAERLSDWFGDLDEWVGADDLRASAIETGEADAVRLVLEYLPLAFSRRHGDPSRPWNRFSIRVLDDEGNQALEYEGNWRDIFQNWEALLVSYPAYLPNVVAKFVNASTIDGFNPYRISRDGIDWEVPDPDDPWSNIGYWGDHQIVYLLRLLEGWVQHEPGALDRWLNEPVFVYADVPYLVADHDAMVESPRDTIAFDDERAAAISGREIAIGSDGRLVVASDGRLVRVGLAEKLLVPALAKLSSFVPGGGIWMNTQRPEWNDANNALAGPGLSMVTLYQLRRYLAFLAEQLPSEGTVTLSSSVARWLADLSTVLGTFTAEPAEDRTRRSLLDAVALTGEAHRHRVLAGEGLDAVHATAADVQGLLAAGSSHLDATIESNLRPDGLFHSYNLVSFPTDRTAVVDHLGPMLEGQVAVLSSGALDPDGALAVIDALFESDLLRPDLDTFLLYPARELAPFTDRNVVASDAPLPVERLGSILVVDPDGRLRFRPEATNAEALTDLLDDTDLDHAERSVVMEAYETTFHHQSFTGRSGSMYGFEGLGSVYWHMVSKLLLAVQEVYWSAVDDGAADDIVERLAAAYRRIRDGLGFRKDPRTFGAFPTDCYSHSPAHSGAQQPGMTGQVKEEILARFGELGLRVKEGRIVLEAGLLPEVSAADSEFTYCGVPMTVTHGQANATTVARADGSTESFEILALPSELSRAVFARDGSITQVTWTLHDGR